MQFVELVGQLKFLIILSCFLSIESCSGNDLRNDCEIVIAAETAERKTIKIQVAASESERNRGLMYRENIKDNQGMLFVFPGEDERSFWMKNTFVPLDMIFIDKAGVVRSILKNVPPHTTEPRKSNALVMYVLELKSGMTEKFGIKNESLLNLDSCKKFN